MFNWLGNIFPYSDLHSLNLDWILSKMKETAAQAAQAIVDSAKALAQVIEAKTAAQNAQTAAQNAQTAAQHAQTAANNAADSAENAVNVAQAAQSAAQTAQETATAANNKAQTAQESATAANNKAQTAQESATAANSAAQTAQETAQSALDKFPVQTADIADGAVLSEKIGSRQITSGKIASSAVLPDNLGPDEMRIKSIPMGYPLGDGSLTITYSGKSLAVSYNKKFFSTLHNNFDTSIARLEGSPVIYNTSSQNKTYKLLYIKTPILFYTSAVNTDIHITCGLHATTGDNVEFDVIIHDNGNNTGTVTIDSGNSVISGDEFESRIRVLPFACELHRAAK